MWSKQEPKLSRISCRLPEPQSADIFWGGQDDCNLLLYLTTKYVYENIEGVTWKLPLCLQAW